MYIFRDLRISRGVIDGALLTSVLCILCVPSSGLSAESFQQDGTGLVSMEAEHFDANTPQGGHDWVANTTPGFSGTSTMDASPNNGTNQRDNYATNSPRLDFEVNFTSPGTHVVWVRGVGRGGSSNSLHVGLNGQEIASAAGINLNRNGNYSWSNGNHTLQVPSAGVHTINVWMREDGTLFDKLVLTSDSGFTPSGIGPNESPRGDSGGNLSPNLNPIGSQSIEEEQTLSFTVSANDSDGLTPILSASPLPPGASFSPSSGLFSWTPQSGANANSPYTLTIRATDATDSAIFDEEIINITVASPGGTGNGHDGFQQDSNGMVAMEAEHFDTNTPQGGHDWVVDTTPGFSGSSTMDASPNTGVSHRTNYAANSPRLDFQVNFSSAGTHVVWVRGVGRGGSSNSVHVGLNGQEIASAAGINLNRNDDYSWSNGNHTLQIPSAGIHTINVWMREDGTLFDKLVLTTNSGFTPSGIGPDESPRGDTGGTGGNLGPNLNPMGSQSVEEEQTLSFTVTASDPDGPAPILSASPLPPGANFSPSSGLFSWTPQSGASANSPYTLTIRATDGTDSAIFDEEIMNITVASPGGTGNGSDGFQQNSSGMVTMEAEHFDTNTPQGGHSWVVDTTPGFSGTSTMDASPNNGTNQRNNYDANSPRLDFQVNFTTAGSHIVWVRGVGRGGSSNSLHVGLNGQEIASAAGINLNRNGDYSWSNGNHSLQIPSAGIHTINVWMREDGTLFDKLMLTTNSGFTPSGIGPDESPRGGTGGGSGGIPVTTTACLSTEDLPIDLNDFVSDDNALLGFSIETPPTKGTVDLQPDGTLTLYIPDAGTTGFDSFTYQVDDQIDGVATGTVNIAVSKTRIMPLGDSITAGNGPEGAGCAATPRGAIPDSEKIGYRARLLSELDDANYMVNFVGGLSFGSSATPPIGDTHHEGHGGFTASQIAQNVVAWLNSNPTDIVLLHVGTNNINSDDPNLTIINIEQILDGIDTWEASNNEVTVLLSTLIERSTRPLCDPNPVYNNINVGNLNGLINNLVASRTNDRLILVDQHGNIVPATHLSEDGVHPNPTGYEQMAVEWLDTLTDTSSNIDILRCPTNN